MELLKPINLLMVKVGTEPGLEAIPSHIKAFNPRVRTYGIISHPSQPHTFDEVITSSWESMLGAHPEYLKKGLYVRPELFKRLRDKEGQLLRMFERVAIHDLTTVANPIDPIPFSRIRRMIVCSCSYDKLRFGTMSLINTPLVRSWLKTMATMAGMQ